MLSRPLLIAVASTIASLVAPAFAAHAPVSVREVDETIPTYLAGPAEPNPMFYFGRASQGAEARIYPYALQDNLTNRKEDKTYRLVYLENEYLKIGIAPELGGRIFSGLDKTNGYDFFYRQHVIKPALIGLIGAWISGGVEWNIPHHHRASTFSPVQHRIEEGPDGAKTVWVGELEVRHRMRWAVGYTLRPGSNVLEAQVRIVNRTPLAQTMLCFANVAVHATDDYQIIFPPSTEWATHHSKREFTSWPIANSNYGGAPLTGVDASWDKNHVNATSMFAWNYWDDFFAGYDHGREAGTMSIADHHIVPGKKFWTWGNGPRGRMWDEILTDTDGPYVELMVGAYSDNQPDYSWLQPFDARVFSMYWYPFSAIGGVKNANLDAAVNLDLAVDGASAEVGFYTTSERPNATATFTAGDRVLFEERIAIGPGKPFTRKVALPAGVDKHALRAALVADGRELVGYTPVKPRGEPMPAVVNPPPAPTEFKTNEELYLAGLRIDQFHNPALEPDPFWEEALKRDPGDARVNTAYGILKLKRLRYAEAEQHFRTAIARLTHQYTTPKDAEPLYYLGLALKSQGRFDEAYDAFYKATWSAEWKGPAYYALAEIASRRGDLALASEHIERSLATNMQNTRAWNLARALDRHLQRSVASGNIWPERRSHDPLDVGTRAEGWLSGDAQAGETLITMLRDFPEAGLEAASDYGNAGLFADAAKVLEKLVEVAPDKSRISPIALYYLAHFKERLGDTAAAADYRKRAQQVSTDYAFPFQWEAEHVLRRAMAADAKDARAPYLLGNLLFDHRPAEARELWELSARLDPDLPVVHRNLALAYMHAGVGEETVRRAIASLERAVALTDQYPIYFFELDQLYESAGVAPQQRLAKLEQARTAVLQRDDTTARLVTLKIFFGQADEAIALMRDRVINIWEGGARFNAGDAWTDAHLVRGRAKLTSGDARGALVDFENALEFPANLRAERREGTGSRSIEVGYWIGLAHEKLGDTTRARDAWTSAANAELPRTRRGGNDASLDRGVQQYHQALAFQKLGQSDRATAIFRELISAGEAAVQRNSTGIDFFSSFGERQSPRARVAGAHFIAGLGHAGLGDTTKARAAFQAALAASPDHLGAKLALEQH